MKKNEKEHIGKRIKKIRSFNGLTQEELASAINKTRSMVSHIERTGEVNYYTLKYISKVLNLPIEQFQEDAGFQFVEESKVPYASKIEEDMVDQLSKEIIFLKSVIENQWKLLFELSK